MGDLTPNFAPAFAARPGTYALILRCAGSAEVSVGRLGTLPLRRGWYVYIGSARGPGGLRARLLHHLRPVVRPHWHIDYLRHHAAVGVKEVWTTCDRRATEHSWSRAFGRAPGALAPFAGFGSSDCDCHAHLFYFSRRPATTLFSRSARAGLSSFPPARPRKNTVIPWVISA